MDLFVTSFEIVYLFKPHYGQQLSVWFQGIVKGIPSPEPFFNLSFNFTLKQDIWLPNENTGTQGGSEKKLKCQSCRSL